MMRVFLLSALLVLAACSNNKSVPALAAPAKGRQIATFQVGVSTTEQSQDEEYQKMVLALDRAIPAQIAGWGRGPAANLEITVTEVDVDISAGTFATALLLAPVYTVKSNVIVRDAQTGAAIAQFPLVAHSARKKISMFDADAYSMSAQYDQRFVGLSESYAKQLSAALYPEK